MSDNKVPSHAGPSRHPTESALLGAHLSGAADDEAAAHVRGCLRCRVFSARLETAERQSASETDLTALTATSPAVPGSVLSALRRGDLSPAGGGPAAGELWRASGRSTEAGGVAMLVWVRTVFASTAAVLPVVLDTDMCDEYSLVLDAQSNPIGIELGVLTGVDGEVLLSNLATRLGVLDIAESVADVRRSADSGRPPATGARTGTDIVRDDDQRIEYRQLVGELLNSLGAPEAGTDPHADADAGNPLALLDALRDLSVSG